MGNEIATPRVDDVDCARAPDTNGHDGWKSAYFAMLTLARQLERDIAESRNAALEEAAIHAESRDFGDQTGIATCEICAAIRALKEVTPCNAAAPPKSLLAALSGNLAGMSKDDLVSTVKMMRRGRDVEQRKAEKAQKELGNILDHWEQLPNDISTDSSMDALNNAMQNALSMLKSTFSPD